MQHNIKPDAPDSPLNQAASCLKISDDGQIQIEAATAFLQLLDPDANLRFTFQTFDDCKTPGHKINRHLARVVTDLVDVEGVYVAGASLYITVNETDLNGRKSGNIKRVRAVWQEDDAGGSHSFPLAPSIVVESSPGKFHRYFLVEGAWPADEQGRADFDVVMQCMVATYGSDPNAKDISRVLRLPGYLHRKNPAEPFMVRIAEASGKRYTRAQIVQAFPAPVMQARLEPEPEHDADAETIELAEDALRHIPADKREMWVNVGMALKRAFGEAGRKLWDEWSATAPEKNNADDQHYHWSTFDPHSIGIGSVFHIAQEHGWTNPRFRFKPGFPELIINASDPTATAKDLATILAGGDVFLFNGHAPVRIVADADNMPRALEANTDTVRVTAHEVCNPVKIERGGKRIAVPLSAEIARLYLYGLEGRWNLKPFRGITTTPILKHDGSFRIADGYDYESGLFCHNIPELTVSERPTETDARAALARLRECFQTFPFADGERIVDADGNVVTDLDKPPGLDESTFLGALFTAVARPSLELAPGFLCDAPAFSGAGTGKGLLVKSICIIGSGVRPSAFTSGHGADELDKRLTAALTQAHPAVFLDNFNSKELNSDILASALTESPAMVRPLGHTKTVPLHTRTFIGITGNSVEIAEDMARRILKTRLDAKMEDPEQRKFAPGFLDRVLESRSALLSDVLTIWRWGRQASLGRGKPLGSYELWSQWCRDPLFTLGMRDPVDRVAEIKAADPRRRVAVDFFEVWWACHRDELKKAAELDPEVIMHIDDKAHEKPNGDLKWSRQKVARFLMRLSDTRVGGYHFQQFKDVTLVKAVAHYKLTRERASEEPVPASELEELPF